MSIQATITRADIIAGSTVLLPILIVNPAGTAYAPTDISSITYTITDLGEALGATPSPVTGHNGATITVSDAMFTATSKMYNGETVNVNFEWIVPTASNQPFPDRNHTYRLEIQPVPVTGFCSPIVIHFRAI